MKKLVSIVIPFYNGKDYVRIMVQSIIQQSYKNWELLMVDDGSSDGAQDYVIDLATEDTRIHYIKRDGVTKVKGACSARNIGLDAAKGEYIIFFDSDDWITPTCVENRVQFMENNKDVDFSVFPYFKYLGRAVVNGDVISGVYTGENDLRNLFIRNLPFTVVSNIYRRDSLLRINARWDENLASIQDADFNLTCILAGLKYKYCLESGFDYYVRMRMNTNSVSKKILTPRHLKSHLYYLEKYQRIVAQLGVKRLLKSYALLIVSFLRIFVKGGGENYCRDLMPFVKVSYRGNYLLKLRLSLLCYLSYRHVAGLNLINVMLFPELPIAYRRSSKKRGIICDELYAKCRAVIEEIEPLMMQ
ncbi:MAG: glycosyltransferase [Bacteroidota bacterium]|nr:glycosyltransferase [Bacteroidota bacterium]